MSPPGELVAFLPSRDLARSAAFFTEVVGLEVLERSDFAVTLRSGPSQLRVTLVPELTPQTFTVLGWDVDDVAAAVAKLRAHDVEPNRYEGFGQDEDGVWTAPSGSRIVWFADPDGNVLSLAQHPS